MASINKKPIAIDLFCGVGGVTEALKQAGFKVLFGVEYDEEIAKSYKKNHKNKVFIEDIRKLNIDEIKKKYSDIEGNLDLLAGCPPCQTFSRHNKGKKSTDLRNYLAFQYYRFIRELKPKYIFLENVPGFQNNENIFGRLKDALETGLGREGRPRYYLKYEVVNAADYGVPQHRERFVLVGIRRDLCENESEVNKIFAKPTHINPNNWTNKCKRKKWITVYDAIGHLEPIKAGETCNTDSVHRAAKLSDLNLLRLKNTPHNGGSRKSWPEYARDEEGKEIRLWLTCHDNEKVSYGDVYGRMVYKKVSPTLTGGCCMLSKGRFGHPEQDRAISLREAALIQSFPPNYKFDGSFSKIVLQIGNAVPVRLGARFFKCINKHVAINK